MTGEEPAPVIVWASWGNYAPRMMCQIPYRLWDKGCVVRSLPVLSWGMAYEEPKLPGWMERLRRLCDAW